MDRVLQSAELGQSAECESGLEIRWAYTLSQRQPARTVAHARNSGRAWGCRVRLEQLACRPLAPIWGWCSLRRRALTAVARVGVRSANDSDRTLGALIDDSTGIHLMAETEACQLKPSWPHTRLGRGVDRLGRGVDRLGRGVDARSRSRRAQSRARPTLIQSLFFYIKKCHYT